MSKELEALENIKHYDTRVGLHEDDYNIIETALKRENGIEMTSIDLDQENRALWKENKKFKRVLEIIIKKNIHVKALTIWNKTYKGKLTYQNYLGILEDCDLGEKLTQEEFDLLKDTMVVMTI